MALDMVGMMLIPTYAAEMLNKGSSAATGFSELLNTGIKMLVAAAIAGAGAIIGGYVCAMLAARVGADIR